MTMEPKAKSSLLASHFLIHRAVIHPQLAQIIIQTNPSLHIVCKYWNEWQRVCSLLSVNGWPVSSQTYTHCVFTPCVSYQSWINKYTFCFGPNVLLTMREGWLNRKQTGKRTKNEQRGRAHDTWTCVCSVGHNWTLCIFSHNVLHQTHTHTVTLKLVRLLLFIEHRHCVTHNLLFHGP